MSDGLPNVNDSAPWSAWYDEHAGALLLYARQVCRRRVDAEDALQEGFLGFWRGKANAQDPRAYLFRCVRNAALSRARHERGRRRREAAVARPDVFHPASTDDDLDGMLRARLDQLPVEQREVVVLKVWGGLTFRQIGEVMAASLHTTASRYRYALKALRRQIPEGCRP